MTMLVAVVVPCPTNRIRPGSSSRLRIRCARPSAMPRDRSPGVDGSLKCRTAPLRSSSTAKSVKVPPTSNPIRYMRAPPLYRGGGYSRMSTRREGGLRALPRLVRIEIVVGALHGEDVVYDRIIHVAQTRDRPVLHHVDPTVDDDLVADVHADHPTEDDVVLDLRIGARQANTLEEHTFEIDGRLLQPRHLDVDRRDRCQPGELELVDIGGNVS